MKACDLKSAELWRLLEEVKRPRSLRLHASMDEKVEDLEKRFLGKFQKNENGCWVWTAGTEGFGYGSFTIGSYSYRANRISWLLFRGDIPEGLMACHNCPGGDNRKCVNPDHLWLGTNLDNMRDAAVKGSTKPSDERKKNISTAVFKFYESKGRKSGARIRMKRQWSGERGKRLRALAEAAGVLPKEDPQDDIRWELFTRLLRLGTPEPLDMRNPWKKIRMSTHSQLAPAYCRPDSKGPQ